MEKIDRNLGGKPREGKARNFGGVALKYFPRAGGGADGAPPLVAPVPQARRLPTCCAERGCRRWRLPSHRFAHSLPTARPLWSCTRGCSGFRANAWRTTSS
eukprot:scaffold19958_cov30-Tisochrysis_lutea.AAC.4